MIEPDRFVLNDLDDTYYLQLQQAWRLVSDEVRESVAIRIIQEQVDGCESWFKANRVLRDVEALFAPFIERNKALQRGRVIEKLYWYARIAEERAVQTIDGKDIVSQEWLVIAQKFLKEAAEMEGLDEIEKAGFTADDLEIPEIEITSDPTAFLEAQKGEYLDYEDDHPEEAEDDEEEEA